MEEKKTKQIILVDNLCPKCRNLDRPDHNCDLCEGVGFLEEKSKEEKKDWKADLYPSGPAWTGD